MQHKYSQGLRLAPIDPADVANLTFGISLHEVMQKLYDIRQANAPEPSGNTLLGFWAGWCNTDVKGKALTQDVEAFANWSRIMHYFCHNYPKVSAERDKWKILELEQNRKVKIPGTDLEYAMRADLLIEEEDSGAIWIVDHKGYQNMPADHSKLYADEQFTGYAWILRELGIPVHGVIVNVLVKSVPEHPDLLKSGKALSVNKSQPTTYTLYKEAIEKYGFKEADYAEFLAMLKERDERAHPIFQQVKIHKSGPELDQFGRELREAARDFQLGRSYRSHGMHCQWCSYKSLCEADRMQEDFEEVQNSKFRKKEDWER